MSKTKTKEPEQLTNEDLDLIYKMYDVYVEHLRKKEDEMRTFGQLAEHFGFIKGSGELFEKNENVFKIKWAIADALNNEGEKVMNLKNKLYRIITNQ